MQIKTVKTRATTLCIILLVFAAICACFFRIGMKTVPVVIREGFDERGHGEWHLMAADLGVPYEAVSKVMSEVQDDHMIMEPIDGTHVPRFFPHSEEKLSHAFKPYGVTKDQLRHEFLLYYFGSSAEGMWSYEIAQGYAVIWCSKIVCIVVTNKGHGYCSQPRVLLHGRELQCKTELRFTRDHNENGSIASITPVNFLETEVLLPYHAL